MSDQREHVKKMTISISIANKENNHYEGEKWLWEQP